MKWWTGKAELRDEPLVTIAGIPPLPGETSEQYRHRIKIDLLRAGEDSQPRAQWSMIARGLIVAYALGFALSVGLLDPRAWPPFASICSMCFFIGWVVTHQKGEQ